jgi:hypothetical protein
LCAGVHALHVHVRTEQENATGILPVCFHAFKDGLGVVKNGATRFEVERTICAGLAGEDVGEEDDVHGLICGVPQPAFMFQGIVSIWSV